MTGTSRKLGLFVVVSALATPCALAALPAATVRASVSVQDAQATFQQGVDFLRRGRDEEALRAFEKVLASNPSTEEAYQLWKSTDHEVWLDILSKEGDFELIAKRLMGLASMGRLERRDDADAIRALISQLGDATTRRAATRQLAAEHGEYAVSYLLPALADSGDQERRVTAMQALAEMNVDVVPPLVAALGSEDAYLRRNVALTLGYIGDPRAVAALATVVGSDPDAGARQAAQDALGRMPGQNADAVAAWVALGDLYLARDEGALAGQIGDVVWSWGDGALVHVQVPGGVYPDAMARQCFGMALAIDPSSQAALSGYVRAQVGEVARLQALADNGEDVAELLEAANNGSVEVGLAGVDAADAALQSAIAAGDVGTAMALVQAVAEMAVAATPGLAQALRAEDGGLRSAAAVALGQIAIDTRSSISSDAVAELSHAVGRQISRVAYVLDGNDQRAAAIAGGLQSQGMMVTVAGSGVNGLLGLRRLPGVDVVLVADRLPDLTTQQVLSELGADSRFAETPVLVISDDADAAAELYGESSAGIVTGDDVSGVEGVMSESLGADREQADQLSRQAAETLASLAAAGADISTALDSLAGTLATRPDAVGIPASLALSRAGTGGQVPALIAVVGDGTRSDESRARAAKALAMIQARGAGSVSAEGRQVLMDVVLSDAGLSVRGAAAKALGLAAVTPAERAALLGAISGAAGNRN